MSFSTHWLDLREPLDMAARNDEVLQKVAQYLETINSPTITDIACGTGSTQRALAPYHPANTNWQLIDNDPQLLKAAKEKITNAITSYHQIDLVANLDAIFELPTSLVTTSAFLDLVSHEWLKQFISKLSEFNLPFYAALSYDGSASCTPKLNEDDEIIKAHNLHQQTDKGFGAGLGERAIALAINLLEQNSYEVSIGASDWRDDGHHIAFQKHLFEGWCDVASEMNPHRSDTYRRWLKNRISYLDDGQAQLLVGHLDIFAIPKP